MDLADNDALTGERISQYITAVHCEQLNNISKNTLITHQAIQRRIQNGLISVLYKLAKEESKMA